MEKLAAAIGTCIGYAIGHILRIAGPELKAFLVGVIRDALKDAAEVGTVHKPLDDAWNRGVHRRDEAHSTGNGPNWDLLGEGKDGVPKREGWA